MQPKDNNVCSFNFQTFDTRQIGLFVNNVSLPGQPYKIDDDYFISACRSLFDVFNKTQMDSGNNIDLDDWKEGYALNGFPLQRAWRQFFPNEAGRRTTGDCFCSGADRNQKRNSYLNTTSWTDKL